MRRSPAMTGASMILSFQLFFRSDCEFNHVIHTLSNAKFHGKADGIDCEAIGASVLELWFNI